jgi:RimJ/RimL family protein N-acetyltransferase
MDVVRHISYRRASPPDYQGILNLQKENLLVNLSTQQAEDGFLVIAMSEKQFDEINRDLVVIVAESGIEIVGYLCGTSFGYGTQFPILQTMMGKLSELAIEGNRLTEENTFIYGPVCIAKSARGTGILNGLYQALKESAVSRYSCCILFISDRNTRSFNAHLKIGMKRLGVFDFNNGLFHIMGASLNR